MENPFIGVSSLTLTYFGTLLFNSSCTLNFERPDLRLNGIIKENNLFGNRSFSNDGLTEEQPATITYSYDPLYRLTLASYSNGISFGYSYDGRGNRLTQTICASSTSCITKENEYDAANRMTSMYGATYTWDDNGNLLNDGTYIYYYNHVRPHLGLYQHFPISGPVSDNGGLIRRRDILGGVIHDYYRQQPSTSVPGYG